MAWEGEEAAEEEETTGQKGTGTLRTRLNPAGNLGFGSTLAKVSSVVGAELEACDDKRRERQQRMQIARRLV